MIELATIGILASISKTIIDSLKGLRELLPGGDIAPINDFMDAFSEHQKRIGQLAEQLSQAEMLGRMLPIWLQEHSKFKFWEAEPSDETLQKLDNELRNFIHDSIRDHFASTFFRTSFEQLPSVLEFLTDIRAKLKQLDTSIQATPHSSLDGWRLHLPVVKVRLNDLGLVAVKLDIHADELRDKLIQELKEASEVKFESEKAD